MTDTVTVQEENGVVVVQEVVPEIIEIITAGPQGAQGIQGIQGAKGDTGDVTPAATAAKVAAEAAATAAASSQTAAAGSASSALASQTAAAGSATAAASSASTATTQASNASTSATNAAGSATAAATSAATAGSQATTATTQAANAATSATNAAASATTATTKAAESATSATSASGSASSAAASASTATTKATEASTSAATASTMATAAQIAAAGSLAHEQTAAEHSLDASTSADNANTSAISASASKDSATASATEASVSASTATTQASNAAASASTAGTQAGIATTKASEATTSASAASVSAAAALASQTASAGSATAANTSAGSAAGSASSALAIYGTTNAQQAALVAAQSAASLAQGYALSASSAIQQDLSGVTAAALHRSPNAVTAMFVYDTSKDSDGGAWTEKCQHTSWYNEALNGKWLGPQPSEAYARNEGATLGTELVSNGTFDTSTTGWTTTGTVLVDSSGVTLTNTGATYPSLRQTVAVTSGKVYRLVVKHRQNWTLSGGHFFSFYAGGTEIGASRINFSNTVTQTDVIYVTAPAGATAINFQINADNQDGLKAGTWDNISVREVTALTTASGDYYQSTVDGKFYKLNPTSGVTETFRGNKADFPRLAGIVAEGSQGSYGSVTIYDLTEPNRPMWIRLQASVNAYVRSGGNDRSPFCVSALNGLLVVGLNDQYYGGLAITDFAKDRFSKTYQFYAGAWGDKQGIRQPSFSFQYGSGSVYPSVIDGRVNAVAMTVLPDAPVDACFVGETEVAMADGSAKRIDQIEVGELVATMEGTGKVLRWLDQGIKEVFEFEFDSGKKITCTADHKIRTSIGWVEAGSLTSEHEVVGL